MKRVFFFTGLILASTSFVKTCYAAALNKQTVCLAKVIYYEDRGGTLKGKIMHAQVVLNRVALSSAEYGKTICDVVFKRNKVRRGNVFRMVPEFSWIGQQSNKIAEPKSWQESLNIAGTLLDPENNIEDYTKGSIYFQDIGIKQKPEKSAIMVALIDHTKFFTMPEQVAEIP